MYNQSRTGQAVKQRGMKWTAGMMNSLVEFQPQEKLNEEEKKQEKAFIAYVICCNIETNEKCKLSRCVTRVFFFPTA